MREKWMKMLPQLMDNFDAVNQIKCPSCGECGGIDYLYIGGSDTRIGYFQVWCNKCLKGIHISRAIAPLNAKFVTFDTDLTDIVPKFKLEWK